jgi:hypothetical protein
LVCSSTASPIAWRARPPRSAPLTELPRRAPLDTRCTPTTQRSLRRAGSGLPRTARGTGRTDGREPLGARPPTSRPDRAHSARPSRDRSRRCAGTYARTARTTPPAGASVSILPSAAPRRRAALALPRSGATLPDAALGSRASTAVGAPSPRHPQTYTGARRSDASLDPGRSPLSPGTAAAQPRAGLVVGRSLRRW